jgi:hypothetical protein
MKGKLWTWIRTRPVRQKKFYRLEMRIWLVVMLHLVVLQEEDPVEEEEAHYLEPAPLAPVEEGDEAEVGAEEQVPC